ncbi:hypothetical protein DTO027B5_2396 [Paecilomyces variotii]|nr:hypothetical protein DTO169C6_2660 [Paecilomyces variotii]KAJ9288150.1 hypothetical protein DTO021C3_4323 [Paecilomyces variotii]KAJ9329076.1 hypothetical protein DTO027B3_476 [Paecilomyces variotii]KAJ9335803.1 hypothetical protein DTO027B5_2396 [Paecilomyces variotii]
MASSCRRLRDNFAKASPRTILQLAAGSAPTFFSPHPHFLLMATARQVSDWAIKSTENTQVFREALQGGIDGLYDFCIHSEEVKAGLTMDDIRRLHLSRFSIINPFADQIDKMVGEQWYREPDFWDGGVSEPETLNTDSNRAAFQIIIYGELFGSSMRAFLEPDKQLPYFDLDARLDYFKYCVPDCMCRSYAGMEVLPVGPYADREKLQEEDQVALQHILTCRRWRRMWAYGTQKIGDHFLGDSAWSYGDRGEDEPWRQKLYQNALQTQGLEGMQLVTLPSERISKDYREKVIKIRQQIQSLRRPLPSRNIGTRLQASVSEAPEPGQEAYVCMASYWPGV